MARQDRKGSLKRRERQGRTPDLGYYLIITNTDATERCFFEGLRRSLPDKVKARLVIKVIKSKTCDMISECLTQLAYDPQYRLPWIVFDRDQEPNFNDIIHEAETKKINVGWSNPCFEVWLSAYFGEMLSDEESRVCCSKFGKIYYDYTGCEYSKSDENLYDRIFTSGNEQKAINRASRKLESHERDGKKYPSEMCPGTTVFHLVKEIRSKKISDTE